MLKTIGTLIQELYGLEQEVLAEVHKTALEKNKTFGHILMKKKLITEDQFLKALSTLYKIPYCTKLPIEHVRFDFIEHVCIQKSRAHPLVQFFEQLLNGPFMMFQRPVDFRMGTLDFKANRAIQIRVSTGIGNPEICFQSARRNTIVFR